MLFLTAFGHEDDRAEGASGSETGVTDKEQDKVTGRKQEGVTIEKKLGMVN